MELISVYSEVDFSALLNIFAAVLPPALMVRERMRFSALAVLSTSVTISPAMHFTR